MPSSARSPIVGVAVVLTAASLFGTLGPLSRFAYEAGMEPLAFVAWRGGIGFVATAAFIAWRIARRGRRLTRSADLDNRARLSLGIAAVMGFVLNLCMFVALGRERLDRPRVVALVLAVIGMVAVVASQIDPASGIRSDTSAAPLPVRGVEG